MMRRTTVVIRFLGDVYHPKLGFDFMMMMLATSTIRPVRHQKSTHTEHSYQQPYCQNDVVIINIIHRIIQTDRFLKATRMKSYRKPSSSTYMIEVMTDIVLHPIATTKPTIASNKQMKTPQIWYQTQLSDQHLRQEIIITHRLLQTSYRILETSYNTHIEILTAAATAKFRRRPRQNLTAGWACACVHQHYHHCLADEVADPTDVQYGDGNGDDGGNYDGDQDGDDEDGYVIVVMIIVIK